MTRESDVTLLLNRVRSGSSEAESELFSVVYDELRRLAASQMRKERSDHTLQATALVHEAFVRLTGDTTDWQGRAHFFAVAARVMRHLLVDYARGRRTQRRQGIKVPLDGPVEAVLGTDAQCEELLAVDEALRKLAAIDARQARVVELRFFTGLSIEEVAEVLGCSSRAVNRDWRMAQAWLRRALSTDAP